MTEYTVNKVLSYFSVLHFSVKDRSNRKQKDVRQKDVGQKMSRNVVYGVLRRIYE